jgi:23S rRNA pseudouridine2605 synthase
MVSHRKEPTGRAERGQGPAEQGERVARALARAGVASRRDAERLIADGRVALNGQVLSSPAVNVGKGDILTLDGAPVADREPARLWRYHKPPGLITTHKDPKGRPTVFERLPPGLPRVISVGRLDLNSEGLLLLTNDGELARGMELPEAGLVRRYRARAFGRASQERLDRLKQGISVEGVSYGPIEAKLERRGDKAGSANVWVTVELAEGKNREVRKVLEAVGLKVNRLIRTSYGPFELGDLAPGEATEVPARLVKRLLAGEPMPAAPPPPPPSAVPLPHRGRISGQRKSGSSPSGGSPAKGRDGGKAAAPKKTYKPGWARPKRRTKGPGRGKA